ncbi:ATP-binding protein [Terrimonas rubra]|uniref:ATP-binding protein n=1 Tax=Terrimonas rubra TaxID=1035890 RepID=A0ABW6A0V4_9BACT
MKKVLGELSDPSVPFNPDIAATFFRSGYIESWGRGIEKIAAACNSFGIPLPVFDTGLSGLIIILHIANKCISSCCYRNRTAEVL